MRAAIYALPQTGLGQRAQAWLDREPGSSPSRYGFHGTLKAPFRLCPGKSLEELESAVSAFARKHAPVVIDELTLGRLGSFFALVPGQDCPPLHRLADDVVREFESFRAPLDDRELARRKPRTLTPRQRDLLDQWGYPYVFDEFRFHLTLTDLIPPSDQDGVEVELREWFAADLGRPLSVDTIAVFVEPEPGAPFFVQSRHQLQNREIR